MEKLGLKNVSDNTKKERVESTFNPFYIMIPLESGRLSNYLPGSKFKGFPSITSSPAAFTFPLIFNLKIPA